MLTALGLVHPSIALPGQDKSSSAKAGKVICKHVTAPKLRDFADKAWPLIRWQRKGGKPKHATIAAWKAKLRCAAGPGHRRAGKRYWEKVKRRYGRHRAEMLLDPWERAWRELSPADQAWAISTGECESGNNPTTNTGNGFLGAFQWVQSTWEAAGGSGSPTESSWYEQAVRAVRWRNIAGASQWPVCGT